MLLFLVFLGLILQAALLFVANEILQALKQVRDRHVSDERRLTYAVASEQRHEPTPEQLTAWSLIYYPDNRAMRLVSSGFGSSEAAYAIWVWRAGDWQLDHGSVAPGTEPGTPPLFEGTYEGHRVKVRSTGR